MENTSSFSATTVYTRLHVWSFALAAAITTLILGLIAWPIHAMMRARAAVNYGMYGGPWHGMAGPHAPLMTHPGFAGSHFLGLIIVMVCAGVGAAILAALYNAFAVRR